MDAKAAAKVLLDGKSLSFSVDEPFTYASGLVGPIYIDCRLLLSDVARRRIIVDGLLEALEPLGYDFIAATATGAIPWGAWVAEKAGKPMVYVRGEAKAHGKGNLVEGRFRKGQTGLVIEDIVNRGGSSMNTISGLRLAGALIKDCVAIYDYQTPQAQSAFKDAGVRLRSLTDFGTAVEVGEEARILSAQQAQEARRWHKDPERWHR
jgi:orotate phosphoribosyltransferase